MICLLLPSNKLVKPVAVVSVQAWPRDCFRTGEEPEISNLSNKWDNKMWTESDLAQAVLAYLAEHPRGMDTLEGIAEWWIMRGQVRVDVEALGRALNQLTERGVLEKIGSGEYARYHLKTQT